MVYGWLHLFSLLFLSLDLAAVFSINDRDHLHDIIRSTLRRWAKLLGALLLIGVVVYLMTS
ncbi:MAG: hypothetical protein NTX50_11495 [Candidatus Sumerlaeota bacterium]|nr:hypothetical protein [Candidatus Sumerlaeota bacterium]